MIYKNELPERLRMVLMVRFFLDLAAALMFLLKGDIPNFKAVLSAKREYLWKKRLPLYRDVRQENLKLTVNKNITEIFHQSIILNFYFKGIKKFREWR